MQIELTGRRVLVTAGAAGIGRAISAAFAEAGARVHLCDVDDTAISRAQQDGFVATLADVSQPDHVRSLFQRIEADWGGLDVLVNNAGIAGPTKAIEEITDAEWSDTVGVNLGGQFFCARAAAPLMKRQASGAIINLSSTAGRIGMPLRVPYSATKYAVRGLTDALAVELGEWGIRVNSLLPGLVDGPRGERVVRLQAEARGIPPETFLAAMLHNISLHSLIDPTEIAAMAVYLASDYGRHISGQSIGICGNFESYRSPLTVKPTTLSFSR